MKTIAFHEQLARVTVSVNGQPLSVNAEVQLILTKPRNLDAASRRVWDQMSQESAVSCTVEGISASKEKA